MTKFHCLIAFASQNIGQYVYYNFLLTRLWCHKIWNMSGIRQKGEFQKGGNKNAKQAKFSEKKNISYPLICTRACTYQRVRNISFSENLGRFVFLLPPSWDSPFCLITDELTLSFLSSRFTTKVKTKT